MVKLESGVVDKELYSYERAKHLINTQKLMNFDNITAFEKGNDKIEIFKSELECFEENEEDDRVENYIGCKINSKSVEIDYNDISLDYAYPVLVRANSVKISGASSDADIFADDVEINSNFFIGAISSKSKCAININNNEKVAIYSFYFDMDMDEDDYDEYGVHAVIKYNGEEIFNESINDYLYIIVVDGELYVDNHRYNINAAMQRVDSSHKYFIKEHSDSGMSVARSFTIEYGQQNCYVRFDEGYKKSGKCKYRVNMENLCGRNVLEKSLL